MSDNPAGGSVSYTKVTESIPGSGRIEYTFTNHDTHSDQNAVSIDPQKSAYSPFTSRAMERGKLIKEEVFKEQEAQPIRRITYTYYMPNQENFYVLFKFVITRCLMELLPMLLKVLLTKYIQIQFC